MLFHVTVEVYPTVILDDDKRSRELLGPHIQNIMGSGKVREAGLLASKRGASSSWTSMLQRNSTSCSGPRSTATLRWTHSRWCPWRRLGSSSRGGPPRAGSSLRKRQGWGPTGLRLFTAYKERSRKFWASR
jgi:hypothetical protein